MKQYRITSDNINLDSEDDCYLSPEDPIHQFKALQYLGGLGSAARIHELNTRSFTPPQVNKAEIQREQNIKPGTEEWFKLWFGK